MALPKEYLPNGAPRTRRVCRSEVDFRQDAPYVAAIDFGTTYCSIAYTLYGSKEVLKCKLEDTHDRVPNAILIDKGKNTVVSFGYRAQAQFAQLHKLREKKNYVYFERMKMILYRTAVSACKSLLVYL